MFSSSFTVISYTFGTKIHVIVILEMMKLKIEIDKNKIPRPRCCNNGWQWKMGEKEEDLSREFGHREGWQKSSKKYY